MRAIHALAMITMLGCASRPYPCATRYVPSVVAQRPFLWEVRGHRGSIVFFGTYQTASADDVPTVAWSALDRSTVFVAEVDEVSERDQESGAIASLLVLPPGVLLDQLLREPMFDRLASLVDEVSREQLRHMKPWVAMMLLTKTAYDFPSETISAALLERARDGKLRTDFLDSLYEQVQFLDSSAGTIKLEQAIDAYPKMACSMTRRLEAYRAGDDVYFTSDIPDGGDPIVARIERWQQALERYLLTDEKVFVAIGTANLLGPYGLLARFEAKGHVVRRMQWSARSTIARGE